MHHSCSCIEYAPVGKTLAVQLHPSKNPRYRLVWILSVTLVWNSDRFEHNLTRFLHLYDGSYYVYTVQTIVFNLIISELVFVQCRSIWLDFEWYNLNLCFLIIYLFNYNQHRRKTLTYTIPGCVWMLLTVNRWT